MSIGKATGWQIELDKFRAGGGSYWVPDPAFGQTLSQLQAGKNLANATANGIESRLGDFKENSNLGPMRELISLLKQKAFLYDQAIAQLTAAPAPTPTEGGDQLPDIDYTPNIPGGDGSDGGTNTDGTGKDGGVMDFIKANPVPFVIGGVLLVNFLLPKKKRFIKF